MKTGKISPPRHKDTKKILSLLVSLCLGGVVLLGLDMTPPVAKEIPKTTTIHGETRTDPYFWLRDRNNPEVIRYLEAENKFTEAMMKHTEELQAKLYKEILGRIKETDLSVPEK